MVGPAFPSQHRQALLTFNATWRCLTIKKGDVKQDGSQTRAHPGKAGMMAQSAKRGSYVQTVLGH